MENVNTTSTFEDPYLPENLITHPSSFFRTMLEIAGIRSADELHAEMNRLIDQPFHPNTIYIHPAHMEILRQDIERDTSRASLTMEEARAADPWSENRYSQSIPPMEIPLTRIRRAGIYESVRGPAPIYTMSSTPTSFSRERERHHAINAPIIEPATIYEEFQDTLNRDCLETLDRTMSSNPEEEVYTPYRTRRTENEPKPAQALLNDLKNYLQAYHDDVVEAEVVYGALNNIFRTIVEIYGERFLPGEITANSRMTLNAFNAKNLWTLQNKELMIHEANFTTFCQWLHKQQ